jgi:FemAB-related protein (PEP-CTERM system-associated)
MTVRLIRQEDREKWNSYVMHSSLSDCYHLIGWKDVIEKTFSHKSYYLISESNDGVVNGILPLVHFNSTIFGNFMVSVPYFNYGGVVAENHDIGEQLLKEASTIAQEEKIGHIELRQKGEMNSGLSVKKSKVCMLLDLPSTTDDLWKSFSSKLRSQIRRPEKEGMYCKVGRAELLDDFYTVFSINMRDLGTPVYSKSFFANILSEFPDKSWISTAYTNNGKAVASGFLVGFKDRLEIPWASSLGKYNCFSPNMLLYWRVLIFACEQGYRIFDFGRSTPGEGTYKFKEQWGSRPVQLFWYYWLRDGGPLPELNPKNPKYRLAINIWKRLPLGLTKILGPGIVRSLP